MSDNLNKKDKPYCYIYLRVNTFKQPDTFLQQLYVQENIPIKSLVMCDANLDKNYKRWCKNYKEKL